MKFKIGSMEFEWDFRRFRPQVVSVTKIRLVVKKPDPWFWEEMTREIFYFETLVLLGRAAANVPKIERDWYFVLGKLYPELPPWAVLKEGGTYEIDFVGNYLNLAYFGTGRPVDQVAEMFHANRIDGKAMIELKFADQRNDYGKTGPLVWLRSVIPFDHSKAKEEDNLLDKYRNTVRNVVRRWLEGYISQEEKDVLLNEIKEYKI